MSTDVLEYPWESSTIGVTPMCLFSVCTYCWCSWTSCDCGSSSHANTCKEVWKLCWTITFFSRHSKPEALGCQLLSFAWLFFVVFVFFSPKTKKPSNFMAMKLLGVKIETNLINLETFNLSSFLKLQISSRCQSSTLVALFHWLGIQLIVFQSGVQFFQYLIDHHSWVCDLELLLSRPSHILE